MNSKLHTFYVVLSIACIASALGLFPWSGDPTARMLWAFGALVCAVMTQRED